MRNRVFLSYAHEDKNLAKDLVDELKSEGFLPWFDEYELHPGEPWEEQRREGLLQSNYIILLIGSNRPSPNVLVEAGMALGQGKQVFVLVAPKSESAKELKPVLSGIKGVNFVNLENKFTSLEGLSKKIARNIEKWTKEGRLNE